MKIARFVLDNYKKRGTRKNTNFDSYANFGLEIIVDVIERNTDYSVGYTSIKTINEYDAVLVTLTSVIDVYNLVYTFLSRGLKAENVRPKVIVGGAGVSNIKTYVEYGDFFVLGRGENAILPLLEYIRTGEPYKQKNVFERGISNFENKLKIGQSECIYPHQVKGMRENMMGCPNKCQFCQYTFAREHKEINQSKYEDTDYIQGSEQTFKDLKIEDGRVYVSAIDGFTERLRKIFLKPITDDEIIEKLQDSQELNVDSRVSLKLYNICGYPTENKKSYEKFIKLIQYADYNKKMTPLLLHILITPFSAEPLTPAQYLPMDLETNYRKYFQQKFVGNNGYVWKGENITLYFMKYINTNWALFQRALINRGGVDDSKIVEAIVNNKTFKNLSVKDKMHNIKRQVDINKFAKRYKIGEPNEWNYLESYIPNKKIDKMAKKLYSKLKA